MKDGIRHKLLAELVLLLGIAALVFSFGALLTNAGGGSTRIAVLASSLVVIGSGLAVIAVQMKRRSRYLFIASFLIQIGVLLLFVTGGMITQPIRRLWPLLSVFAGLALLPAGWQRYGKPRGNYIVPALTLVSLGVFLLFFAFKVLPFSFKGFILTWWPLLLLLAGIVLTLVSVGSRGSDTGESDP